MNIDFEKYNQIESYLNGSLKGDALESFESDMSENLDLRTEVEYHKIANEIIVDESLVDVKSRLSQMHKKSFPWKTVSVFVLPIIAGTVFLLNLGNTIETENLIDSTQQNIAIESNDVLSNAIDEDQELLKSESIERKEGTGSTVSSVGIIKESTPKPQEINNGLEKEVRLESSVDESIKAVEKEVVAKTISCDDVSISANLLIENTCAGMSNGIVELEPMTLVGGEGPYEFSVLSSKTRIKKKDIPFETANTFNGLAQGYYSVFIKDKNGCISYSPKAAYVNASICQEDIDGIFLNTDEHESWLFENKEGVSGTVKIVNTDGDVEFEKPFNDSTQLRWFGKNSKGEYLSSGHYSFELDFDNGKKQKGNLQVR